MNKEAQIEKINIKRWLEKSLALEGDSIQAVGNALVKILKNKKFKISNRRSNDGIISIEAIYGSKIRAFFFSLIPFIGKHLTSGKRFLLKADLRAHESMRLNISITPYMELFDMEELGNTTQSITEKVSDEYAATKMLFCILKNLHSDLKLPLPEELSKLNVKSFAHDTFWEVLLFYLDSYSTPKTMYSVQGTGPRWCWGAFIIPECWFMWHDLWGASSLMTIPTGLFVLFRQAEWLDIYNIKYLLIIMIILCRIIAGLTGNKIFFARYGYFPNEKQFFPPHKGPKWNWGAFIIPEFWFMWHEMLGIASAAIALDVVLFAYIATYTNNSFLNAVIFFFIRVIFGLKASELYYAKHGTWPK